MTRSTRTPLVAVAALALALTGCSGATVDVPAGAQPLVVSEAPATSAAAASAAPAPAAPVAPALTTETLDCEAVLPVRTIESVLDLPEGFSTLSEQPGACAWAMAGNPGAILLQAATGATLEELTARQTAAVGAVGSDLGEGAFFQPADPALDPAATLTVLSGERLVSIRSSIGTQEALETLAEDVLAALDASG